MRGKHHKKFNTTFREGCNMLRYGWGCLILAAACAACVHVTVTPSLEAVHLSCDTDEHGNGKCERPGASPALLSLRMRGWNVHGFRGGLVCSELRDALSCFLLEFPVRTSKFKIPLPKGERYFWPDGVCVGTASGSLYCRWFNPMNYPGSLALSSQEILLSSVGEFSFSVTDNGACFCAETKAFCLLSSPDGGAPVSLGVEDAFIHPPYLVQTESDGSTACTTSILDKVEMTTGVTVKTDQ